MDMDDFTFPATLTATPEPPAVVAGQLPAAATSSSPPCIRSPPSPPAAAAAAPPVTRKRTRSRGAPTGMAPAQQAGPPGAGGHAPAAAAAVAEVEDRMDMLWEDFNEAELPRDPWSDSESESSDAELSSEPAARGCAPMLRPSSRAGGAVRRCRRRAGTWVLLMRIFRRLFVIDKTVSAAAASSRRHHAAATTTTRAS